MKTYTIKKCDISCADIDFVNSWPWNYSYEPRVQFKVSHNGERFFVSMRTYEKNPVAHITSRNGMVCNDSCMEIFISPSEDCSNGYFNFEANAHPSFLLQYNRDGFDKNCFVEWEDADFNMKRTFDSDGDGNFWQLDFEIPFAMIHKYVPEADLSSGSVIRGNVYKCGCHDQEEHYGSWNPVSTPSPNFHIKECFGKFIIE